MILGFTKKKIMSIILLLGCIFISLAMSHIPFLVSDHKAGINMEGMQEGITNPTDDLNDEGDDEGDSSPVIEGATAIPVKLPIPAVPAVPAPVVPAPVVTTVAKPATTITTTVPAAATVPIATTVPAATTVPGATTVPATIIGNTAAKPTTITTPIPVANITTTPVSASTTLTTTSTTPPAASNSPTTLVNVPSANAPIQTSPYNVMPNCSSNNLLSAKILMNNMDYVGVKNILNSCNM